MFPERLKELRKEKGVTQKVVADYLGITIKAYCFYELGQRMPPIPTLLKLCEFFGVSSDYLLGRTDSY